MNIPLAIILVLLWIALIYVCWWVPLFGLRKRSAKEHSEIPKKISRTCTRCVNGTKKTMTPAIYEAVTKHEEHLEELSKLRKEEVVNSIKKRLRNMPALQNQRNIGFVVLDVANVISTSQDHEGVKLQYILDLMNFAERHILGDDDSCFRTLHFNSVGRVPELIGNKWLMLSIYLQDTFCNDDSERKKCCCGFHAGMHWFAIRNILFDEKN